MATKLGALAAIMPHTAVTPSVKLKAHRRPNTSQPKPQNRAPISRPMFCARVRRGGSLTSNSFVIGVSLKRDRFSNFLTFGKDSTLHFAYIREVTMGHRLSLAPVTSLMSALSLCNNSFSFIELSLPADGANNGTHSQIRSRRKAIQIDEYLFLPLNSRAGLPATGTIPCQCLGSATDVSSGRLEVLSCFTCRAIQDSGFGLIHRI